MKKCLAFVLSGGGARGALQVGALRALIEAGWQPDLLVGTSVGAMNAACLALHGVSPAGLVVVEQAWQYAAQNCLLTPNQSWLTLRAMFNRPDNHAITVLRAFFLAFGATPSLRFGDIPGIRLALVAADLNTGRPVIFGTDPNHRVLDGLLASTALPPWVMPLENDGKYLVDGGALSNLPVEPALGLGATEIVALDLADPAYNPGTSHLFSRFFDKLAYAVGQRQSEIEIALARSRGVPVHHIRLSTETATPIWDFSGYRELIARGYEIAQQELSSWKRPRRFWPVTWRQIVVQQE
jgi:NTE family protein